jgi:CDGSH-type Zn-finger protein
MRHDPDDACRATVTMYPDGPLIVRGDFEIRDVDGTRLDAGRTVALCRCGRSAVKPLCDGSHKRGALAEAEPRADGGAG